MDRYLPLIQFTLNHPYYADGICRDLELQISSLCKKTVSNYNLLLKKKNGSSYLLYIKSSEELAEAFEKELKQDDNLLIFVLKTTNPRFFCYTDKLPNISKNQRSVYRSKITKNNQTNTTVSHINAKQMTPETRLHFESQNILGIVQLNTLSTNGPIFRDTINRGKPIDLQISFEVKSAFWKYVLLPRSTGESKLTILDSNEFIEFSDIAWTSINNREKAGISVSIEKIKLSDQYPFHLQLWRNYTNGKQIVLEQLSIPNIENPESFSVDSEMNNYITIYQYF